MLMQRIIFLVAFSIGSLASAQDAPAVALDGEPVTDDGQPAAEVTSEQITPVVETRVASPEHVAAVPDETPTASEATAMTRWMVRSGAHEAHAFAAPQRAEHLVTVASVFRDRGSVRAYNVDTGFTYDATIVRVHRESGLALVQINAPAGPEPSLHRDVRAGTWVTAPAGDDDEPASGVVNARRGHRLEVSVRCSAGDPLFDDTGALAAVCRGEDRAVSAETLDALVSEEAPTRRPGRFRVRVGVDLNLRVQKQFENSLGASLNLGVVGWDRLGFAIRVGLQRDAELEADDAIEIGSIFEGSAEIQLHHAFRVAGARVRLVFGAGATFRVEETTTRQTLVGIEPGCDITAGLCPGVVTHEDTSDRDLRILPSLRLELDLGVLAASYTATIDVDDASATTHTFGFGLVY